MEEKDKLLYELLDNVKGNIFINDKAVDKKEIIREAENISHRYSDKKVILLQVSDLKRWWVYFMAALLNQMRIVIADVKTDRDAIDNIITECKADIYVHDLHGQGGNDTEEIQKTDTGAEASEGCEIILYTTGTKGKPKGVVMPFDKYIKNQYGINGMFQVCQKDVSIHMASLAHSMGLAFSLVCFWFGGDMHYCGDTVEFYQKLILTDCHVFMLQPSLFSFLLTDGRAVEKMKKMKFVAVGGGPLSEKSYKYALEKGINLINGYGMTECISGIASGATGSPSPDLGVTPINGIKISISPEGEILARGDTVCEKYVDGTDIISADGWYHTGDMGLIKDDRLYVRGRIDDVIILENGYKVNPVELEERICAVRGVIDARVYYNGGKLRGEVVKNRNMNVSYDDIYRVLYFYEAVNLNFVSELTLHKGKKRHK